MPPAISVRGLNHFYGLNHALKDISFTVEQGRFTVLLGLNGAGKTTLFSLLTRLYSHNSGEIDLCGYDIRRQSGKALSRLGIVFQSRTLDLDLSLKQNLSYHAALHGMSGKKSRALIEQSLSAVDLLDKIGVKTRSLSGGQMRRVEIARALLHRPDILLLDEPTVGLDVNSRASIVSIIRDLVRTQGISVLWSTHLMDEVQSGDDLLVLHRGELLASGKMMDVLRATKTATIQDAFAALTSPPTAMKELSHD